ncbi:MAG: polysaccharide deacetylase family protein [Anaerolineae bacterium]|nr:polysaccharide deacetylase family protein [Anaerolineae bacterium]
MAEAAGIISLLQWSFWDIRGKSENWLYVLNYHRVDYPNHRPWLGGNVISTSPDEFQKQMNLIARRYHPVTAEEVINSVRTGSKLPKEAILITVDDGYKDFKEYIHPITHGLGIKPVLFVATHFVGENMFWWDKLHHIIFSEARTEIASDIGCLPLQSDEQKEIALKSLSAHLKKIPFAQALKWIEEHFNPQNPIPVYTLGWDELRELSREGVTIAAHTHTHPILTQIPIEKARLEIKTSQQKIKQEIGQALPIFAFPDGKPYATSDDLVQVLREEGFQIAFTTIEGRANLGRDNPLLLPRLGVWEGLNLGRFHFHLTPTYDHKIRQRAY